MEPFRQEPASDPALPRQAEEAGARVLGAQSVLPEAVLGGAGRVLERPGIRFNVAMTTEKSDLGLIVRTRANWYSVEVRPVLISASRVKLVPDAWVRLSQEETERWWIGFIQTVEIQRWIWVTAPPNQYVVYKWELPETLDGKAGGLKPWYDPDSTKRVPWRADVKSQYVDAVGLFDQPGFEDNLRQGFAFDCAEGWDKYKTWLVARRADGTHTSILGCWRWSISWDTKNADRAGVTELVEAHEPLPSDRILIGSWAKDAIQYSAKVYDLPADSDDSDESHESDETPS